MHLKRNIATSETGFIFNPSTGDSFSANPVAAEIIACLKEGMPATAIKKKLLDKYEVESFQLEKDWDDFFTVLKEANLLEK